MEHTADVGLRIRGRDLKELFIHAAAGFFDLVTEVETGEEPSGRIWQRFQLGGENTGDLLLKWLRELLFVFSTKRIIFKEFEFKKLTDRELDVHAVGVLFDPARHGQKVEVKAVTYHGFKLETSKEGWMAEIIFDI